MHVYRFNYVGIMMYAAVSKLASIAQQAPEANHAEIDTLVKEILTDDDQLITAREASKIPTAPSYATLARWRSKGIGPSFVKNPTNGHVLYRKGDFRPQLQTITEVELVL